MKRMGAALFGYVSLLISFILCSSEFKNVSDSISKRSFPWTFIDSPWNIIPSLHCFVLCFIDFWKQDFIANLTLQIRDTFCQIRLSALLPLELPARAPFAWNNIVFAPIMKRAAVVNWFFQRDFTEIAIENQLNITSTLIYSTRQIDCSFISFPIFIPFRDELLITELYLKLNHKYSISNKEYTDCTLEGGISNVKFSSGNLKGFVFDLRNRVNYSAELFSDPIGSSEAFPTSGHNLRIRESIYLKAPSFHV